MRQNLIVGSNVLREIGQHGIVVSRKSVTGVFEQPPAQIHVSDNVIRGAEYSAIRVIAGEEVTLSANCCAGAEREAVYISDTSRAAIKGNVLRGAAQGNAGLFSAVRLEACTGAAVSGNLVSNDGYNKLYSYALYILSGNTGYDGERQFVRERRFRNDPQRCPGFVDRLRGQGDDADESAERLERNRRNAGRYYEVQKRHCSDRFRIFGRASPRCGQRLVHIGLQAGNFLRNKVAAREHDSQSRSYIG